jgi:DNA (cytosine-5)-methyltransferase 1
LLTVGSLFSGIGGIELGLERTGYFKTLWQVENDPYATEVLKKHWPKVKRYGDIRTVKKLPYADLICGGFPCQDISNAGQRKGITGERSGLWKEFVRIIRLVRPKYILVENVSALISRGLDIVLWDLAQSGYDAEWTIISACAFGASHPRQRLFLVAYPNKRGLARRREELQPRIFQAPRSKAVRWNLAAPYVCRASDGIPNRVDRIKCLGNAVVPQVAEFIGGLIVQFDKMCKQNEERVK